MVVAEKTRKQQIRGGNVYYHVHGDSHKIKQNDKCVSVSRTLCGVTSQGHLFLRFLEITELLAFPTSGLEFPLGGKK